MPGAVCSACGARVRWRNQRGARLAATPCPQCGGQLTGASVGRSSPNAGKPRPVCAACGTRSPHFTRPDFEWEPRSRMGFRYRGPRRDKIPIVAGPHPAGAVACRHCEPCPVGRVVREQVCATFRDRYGTDPYPWEGEAGQLWAAPARSRAAESCPRCGCGGRDVSLSTRAGRRFALVECDEGFIDGGCGHCEVVIDEPSEPDT